MLVDMPAIPDATRAAPPPSTASVAPGAKFADTLAASTNAVLPETEANPSCVSDPVLRKEIQETLSYVR